MQSTRTRLPVWPCGSWSRGRAQILRKLQENKPKDLLQANEEGTKICPVGYFAARPLEHLTGLDDLCESQASGFVWVFLCYLFSQGYHAESLFNKALTMLQTVRYDVHISIIRRLFIFLFTLGRNKHVSWHTSTRMTHVHLSSVISPLLHLIPFCHSISPLSLCYSSRINVS